MKYLFVPYEIALQLKIKGFDEPCLAYYTQEAINTNKDGNKTNFVLLSEKLRGELSGQGTCKNSLFQWLKDNDRTSGELYILSNSITAPLYQQVIDWLWNNYRILIYPYLIPDKTNTVMWCTNNSSIIDFWSTKDQAIKEMLTLILK